MKETGVHRYPPSFPGWRPGALHLTTFCIYSLTFCMAPCRVDIKRNDILETFGFLRASCLTPHFPQPWPPLSCRKSPVPDRVATWQRKEKVLLVHPLCRARNTQMCGTVCTSSQEVKSSLSLWPWGRISWPSVATHPKFQQQPPAISDGDDDDSTHHILVSGQPHVAQIPSPPFYR